MTKNNTQPGAGVFKCTEDNRGQQRLATDRIAKCNHQKGVAQRLDSATYFRQKRNTWPPETDNGAARNMHYYRPKHIEFAPETGAACGRNGYQVHQKGVTLWPAKDTVYTRMLTVTTRNRQQSRQKNQKCIPETGNVSEL